MIASIEPLEEERVLEQTGWSYESPSRTDKNLHRQGLDGGLDDTGTSHTRSVAQALARGLISQAVECALGVAADVSEADRLQAEGNAMYGVVCPPPITSGSQNEESLDVLLQ